jgi:hypothetical protein
MLLLAPANLLRGAMVVIRVIMTEKENSEWGRPPHHKANKLGQEGDPSNDPSDVEPSDSSYSDTTESVGLNTGIPQVRFSHTTPIPVYTVTHCG